MANKAAKTRMCICCRHSGDKDSFYRIVSLPDGKTAVDIAHNFFGRGAYICKKEDCILKAQKIRALERAFKRDEFSEIYAELLMMVKKYDR